jgi:penicillin-binding protein 1A
VLSTASFMTASAFKWAEELPDLSTLDTMSLTATSHIFAHDGTPIGDLVPTLGEDRASTNRTLVTLDEVSPAMLAAIIASEDDGFFRHYGFEPLAILKAVYTEFFTDDNRGGSTITIQTIKNTVLSELQDERTLERKAKELMLAVELERRLTKPEILQWYINVVYWGGNLYGIHAAAEAYFGKKPIDLNLAEGLYLARLIPLPHAFYEDFAATRQNMRAVLNNMVAKGTISRERADEAWRYNLQPRGWQVEYDGNGNIVGTPQRTDESISIVRSVSSDLAPHVTYAVRDWLLEKFGRQRVFGSGGLRVYTTIDRQAQEAANRASRNAELPEGAQVAIVGIDPETGRVLAMVGEHLREGVRPGEYNRAMARPGRQPGSSFKPIIYATAFEQGLFTQSSVVMDERISMAVRGQPNWEPQNHDKTFAGSHTLRYHLNFSRNIPVAKLVEAVTPEAVVARARELGYTNMQPFLSIALGSTEVTPLQHASAMGAFANKGVHVSPYIIERVEDADGNVLYQYTPRETRVWSEQTAYLMLDLMHGNVVDPGAFSRRAAIEGRWVAGKTGTTNDDRDIWFVGMTPGIVAAVWIGYDQPRPVPRNIPAAQTREGDGQVNSSRQPVYAWREFVTEALRGVPTPAEYPVPEGITFRNINLQTGLPDPRGVRMAFASGTESLLRNNAERPMDPITIPIDTRTKTRATANTPREFITWINITPDQIGQYSGN